MIQQTGIAKRYAKALFELAQEHQVVLKTEQQLKEVARIVLDNKQLYLLLTSPNIGLTDKIEVLHVTFQNQVSNQVARTLQLLVERGRIHLLQQLVDHYIGMAGDALGLLDANVTTAYPLNKLEKQAVAAQFGRKLGKNIRIQTVVDTAIIGGMLVRIGDRLYDGSIAGKLARINHTLKTQV